MRTLAYVVALVLLAGCSSAPSAPPSVSTTTTSTTAATAVVTSSTPTPTSVPAPGVAKVGDTVDLGTVKITVLAAGMQPKGSRDAAPFGVRIKACNTGSEAVRFGSDPWTVVDADDGAYQRSGDGYGSDPKPSYPWNLDSEPPTKPGQCVQGWIVYDVGTAKIGRIRYYSGAGEAEWQA